MNEGEPRRTEGSEPQAEGAPWERQRGNTIDGEFILQVQMCLRLKETLAAAGRDNRRETRGPGNLALACSGRRSPRNLVQGLVHSLLSGPGILSLAFCTGQARSAHP